MKSPRHGVRTGAGVSFSTCALSESVVERTSKYSGISPYISENRCC